MGVLSLFAIDPERSRLVAVARSNLHPVRIETPGLSGSIEARVGETGLLLDPPPRARVELPAALLQSGIGLYDREIQRVIQARKHPRLSGELDRTEPWGQDGFRLFGRLDFHGVVREVMGTVRVRIDGDEMHVEGEQTLDIRDFDLTPPRILMLRVEPTVEIAARVVAVRR